MANITSASISKANTCATDGNLDASSTDENTAAFNDSVPGTLWTGLREAIKSPGPIMHELDGVSLHIVVMRHDTQCDKEDCESPDCIITKAGRESLQDW